jgi:cholesterol oxidase
MLGCPHGAKNTLDQNYLWLAEKHHGAEIRPETTVKAVRPAPGGGYLVETEPTFGWRKKRRVLHADRVVLSAGVMGTTELLLRMKDEPDGLPELSDHTGQAVRTNSETLIGVTSRDPNIDLTQGVAIGSILHTDAHSHLEPVRYPAGNGLYRLMVLPHAPGDTLTQRMAASARTMLAQPRRALAATFVKDWSKSTAILLYMRTTEGTLGFRLGRFGLSSQVTAGEAPTASIPEATELAERFAEHLDGFVVSMFTETLANIPTTAHILGGATIGATAAEGVIGPDHQVHHYPGLYVCDGSAVSANPGVNPSLTITAMSERAMAALPPR